VKPPPLANQRGLSHSSPAQKARQSITAFLGFAVTVANAYLRAANLMGYKIHSFPDTISHEFSSSSSKDYLQLLSIWSKFI